MGKKCFVPNVRQATIRVAKNYRCLGSQIAKIEGNC